MKLHLPSATALLHLSAACWLFLQFAPNVRWLPGELNDPARAIGAVCALLVIVLVIFEAIKASR